MFALFIPVDGPCEIVQVLGLESMQKLVGGYVECLCIPDSDNETELASLWMNEEGKLEGLPLNPRATWLVKSAFFVGIADDDFIAGPAFLLGPADEEGSSTSVGASLFNMLLRSHNCVGIRDDGAGVPMPS